MAFLEIVGATALGGAITYGTTRAFEQRRERRADERERAAVKAAAKIAHTDMRQIRRNLRNALTSMYWPASAAMPTSGWQQQGDKLAGGALESRDYEAVAHAFARAADLERTFQSLLGPTSTRRGLTREGMPAVALGDDLAPELRGVLKQVEAALGILAEVAHEGKDPPSDDGA